MKTWKSYFKSFANVSIIKENSLTLLQQCYCLFYYLFNNKIIFNNENIKYNEKIFYYNIFNENKINLYIIFDNNEINMIENIEKINYKLLFLIFVNEKENSILPCNIYNNNIYIYNNDIDIYYKIKIKINDKVIDKEVIELIINCYFEKKSSISYIKIYENG